MKHASLVLLALLCPLAATAQPVVDAATLGRIQRECLLAYTPEMLRELFGFEQLPEGATDDAVAVVDQIIDVMKVEKGRFYPFLLEDLTHAFSTYLKPGTRFLDLGSGDGRVVFYAAALGADATGIEYDPQVFGAGERARAALGDLLGGKSIRLIQDDFFKHSWSGYDVIFYFDLGSFDQNRLRKKIFSELDPDARLIVGHQRIPFPGLELETTYPSLHVYRQAETLAEYDPKLEQYARQEVLEVYAFLEDWYNGEIAKSEENLARYGDVLERGFEIIDSRGAVVGRDLLLDVLRGTYGKWRDDEKDDGKGAGEIRIENFRLRFIQDSVVGVTFEEFHTVRAITNQYKTTAILRLRHGDAQHARPNNVEWLHAHQSDLRIIIRPPAETP